MHLVTLGAHERNASAGIREPARLVRRLAEHRRTDDEDRVVGRKPFAKARPVGGQIPREEAMILVEACARTK